MSRDRLAAEPRPPAEQQPFPGQPGRYVVLLHKVLPLTLDPSRSNQALQARGDHYDWMFEVDGSLLTWATERWLDKAQPDVVTAIRLPDHRLAYLDYEGEVSGDRGTVRRVESGVHRLLHASPDRYAFAVQGDRIGILVLYRTAPSAAWSIAFEP